MNSKSYPQQRYKTLNEYLQTRFGCKTYKLSLNAGLTCPNRDGTCGQRGCIFCSAGGSGDFASSSELSIHEQLSMAKQKIFCKMPKNQEQHQFIAYFQAFTNTYASVDYLENIYMEAILEPDVCAISIATRPDCLGPEVISLLARLNKQKPVWVELGLQTIHESTALFIRRGYPLSEYVSAVDNLTREGIEVIVHVILGLPYETKEMMLETIDFISNQPIKGIKLQLLHVLANTDLADFYQALTDSEREQIFLMMQQNAYYEILLSCIDRLSPDIIIHRITGDGDKKLLLAPRWSGNKREVLNSFQKVLSASDTWQGRYYKNKLINITS